MSFRNTSDVYIRFNDIDAFGHVNNAVYLTYLEQARFNLWKAQMGFVARSADEPGPRGIGFILGAILAMAAFQLAVLGILAAPVVAGAAAGFGAGGFGTGAGGEE